MAASADSVFAIDATRMEDLKRRKPWLTEPKYFKRVKINAVAAMKMTTHAAAGVEKGLRAAHAMPIEVMGLLHGHMSTEEPGTIVVTDAFPLPVEGTETMVMAENESVTSYMINLGEALEKTRSETFMGWYHSHPFDVGPHSNAFLSATDVSTQLLWQISEDAAGNPWLALVVDPLRGVAKGKPEIGAFRCYPTNYTPPKGLAPDGVSWDDERARNARWGESCISYHQLDVDYVVPALTSSLLSILARDFMWTRVLSSTPMLEKEARDRLPDRLAAVSRLVETGTSAVRSAATSSSSTSGVAPGLLGMRGSRGGGDSRRGKPREVSEAASAAAEVASELSKGQASQDIKRHVFNLLHARGACRHAHHHHAPGTDIAAGGCAGADSASAGHGGSAGAVAGAGAVQPTLSVGGAARSSDEVVMGSAAAPGSVSGASSEPVAASAPPGDAADSL